MSIENGVLKSGKSWELLPSNESAVNEGQHLILQITPQEENPTLL